MNSNRYSRFNMVFRILISILLHSTETFVSAQDVCSCTPLVYEWRLDFQRSCLSTNVTVGPSEGIKEADCSVEAAPQSSARNNLTPVKVTAYQIIELDLMLTPLKSYSAFNISMIEGDVITFASISAAEEVITGGFQVSLLGVNSDLQEIVLEWLVRYSNICEKVPYAIGDSIGWMVYNGGIPSRPATCLFPSNEPSQSPSIFSTDTPSSEPSTLPTPKSSLRPSERPSSSPSAFQTRFPSSSPTILSSSLPSNLPSFAPSNLPSLSPTAHPSLRPRKLPVPSNTPSKEPSDIPTEILSKLPSSAPSENPRFTDQPSATPTIYHGEFSMSFSISYKNDAETLNRWLDEYVTDFGEIEKIQDESSHN